MAITGAPTVNFANVASAGIDGQGGNDTLDYNTPVNAAGSNLTYIPGYPASDPDSGTIDGNLVGGSTLTPLTFCNLGTGTGAVVSFTTANAGRTDHLNVEGTAAGDTFNVNGTNGGTIQIIHDSISTNLITIPITAVSIGVLELDGSGLFNLTGTLPFTSTVLDGGGTATFTGASGPVTVNLADSSVPTVTTITGYGGTVSLIGPSVADLNAGGFAGTVNGTTQPDSITVTPTATGADTVTDAGLDTTFYFTNLSTAAAAFTIDPLGGANTVTVNGTSANDAIGVVRATTTDTTTVNGLLPAVTTVNADTQSLVVASGVGIDTVTVSGAGGPTVTVQGAQAPASDALIVNNTAASGNTTVTPGNTNDSGTVANADGTIKFSGLTSVAVNDNAASTTDVLTVLGTNGNDAITTAHLGTNNIVWVNSQAIVTFTNFNQLTLNGKFGNDTFAVSPVGLTFVGTNPQINVSDLTLGNSLVTVYGSAVTATDAFTYNPSATSAAAGSVAITGSAPVVFTDVPSAAINGQGGNDTITYHTPANASGSSLVYTPGTNPDSGTITGTQVGATALTPLAFSNLGAGTGAVVSFTTANAGRTDHLNVEGSAAGDNFTVNGPLNGGTIQITRIQSGNTNLVTIPITAVSVSVLELDGLGGNDTSTLTGTLPFTSTVVDDGSTVNLTGASGTVAVNLADNTVNSTNPNTTITGYGGTVTLIGVDTANLDATASTQLNVVGTSLNDTITYTPSSATNGTFTNAGLSTVFNFANLAAASPFEVFGGTGGNADQVTVQGTAASDLIEIDQGAGTAQVLANDVTAYHGVLLDTSVPIMNALGLGGEDTFQIIPHAGVAGQAQSNLLINVDGGNGGSNNAVVLGTSFAAAGAGNVMGTLPATTFVVDNRGSTTSGTFASTRAPWPTPTSTTRTSRPCRPP